MGLALAAVPAVMALAGTTVSAVSAVQQGNARSEQDTINAQIAADASASALQRGSVLAGNVRTKGSQVIGQQIAGYGSSGVDTQSGSPLATMASSRMMSELDARTQENNAARQAWGYQVQQTSDQAQAALDRRAGALGATGTILGGIGQFASSTWGKSGVWTGGV